MISRARPAACAATVFLTAVLSAAFAAAQPATASAPASAPAAKKPLTLEAIYGPKGKVDFDGSWAQGLTWADANTYRQRREGTVQSIDALTGEARPSWDAAAFEAALRKHAGFDEAAARKTAREGGLFSPDRNRVLVTRDDVRYVYEFSTQRVFKALTGPADEVQFSPGGKFLSFRRDHNLYVVEATGGLPRRLTGDGSPTRLNGKLDWVYQEEVYGRGQWRAYWWSPDERKIAFLQLDETHVPQHTLIDQATLPQKPEQERYPKAGEPNPTVRLGVAGLGLLDWWPIWVDLSKYQGQEILIVRVGWSPDNRIIYQVQDRRQTWLDLNEADPHTGRSRTLFRETSPAWVNVLGEPYWLADGSFLWLSERDGYEHIYHYRRGGELIGAVTSGPWDVRDLEGVDQSGGWVYFTGTRDSPIEEHVYRVRLDGRDVQRLTEPGFSHSASFDPTFQRFIDTYSNRTTPPRVNLNAADGRLLRVISPNPVHTLDEYRLGAVEFLRVPNRDGAMLNAMLIKPPDFDPSRKYPVWCPVYGGPQSPTVENVWRGQGYLFDQLLAEKGLLIWSCDPRLASHEGAQSAWPAYRELGKTELADIEDGLKWLIAQGFADPSRVGISGGSYGGYMTCYAMTHSTLFKIGIAGYSVTDWRNYDSIYTERYMDLPERNPDGYKNSSALEAADKLHGKLLIYHGLIDENVHPHNTIQFIDRLQQAGKQFDVMFYARDRHGIGRGARHLRELRLNYILGNL